jgi:ABC-type nitrate/sulfonate/bicarbonate transport system permease component
VSGVRIGALRLGRGVLAVLLLPAVLLAVWWVTSDGSTTYYFPPLRKVFETFGETWFHGRITADVVPSLLRLAAGYALALAIGIPLGILIGSLRRVRAFLEPVLEFLRAIPPPVLVPVLVLFAGLGDVMRVVVIVSGALWPILLNTVEGVRAVDETLRETCRCYGIRGISRLRHLVVRSASPQIVTGMRQGLSIAIILMVISEMVAAQNGLGYTIIQFQRGFAVAPMWTGIIILGLLGFALAMLLRVFEWRTLRWYRGLREAQRGRS